MLRAVNSLDESTILQSTARDANAGFGVVRTPRGTLPLVALDVRGRLVGLAQHVTLRQTFRNALSEPLEATYVFPLPDRAAVTACRIRIGARIIEAELKDRSAARQEYWEAVEAGHRAALAEEDRSGTFQLQVGNILPGEQIEVELALVGTLPVSDGEATFRFPLVVAPRYVAGMALDAAPVGGGWAPDTEQVPDASRVTPPVLLPGFPNPVQLSLEVEIDPQGLAAGESTWLEGLRSSLHSVIVREGTPCTVRLQPGERLNRDFLLRFPLAAAAIQSTLLETPAADGKPGVLALTLVPPALPADHRPAPRDVVLVLDRSGSMGGWKMVAARRAAAQIVETLLDADRFAVLAFDTELDFPEFARQTLVAADAAHRWQACEWLRGIESRGGTEMGPALEVAVRLLANSSREARVVLVTDGEIAGEDAVLKQLQQAAGPRMPRVHSVGIDQAVNAGFLQRLAGLSGGACELVESEDRLEAAMEHIQRMLGAPALSNLQIVPQGLAWDAASQAPERLPDLFPDRPVMIFARHALAEHAPMAGGTLRLSGLDAAGRPWQQEVTARPADREFLVSLWGRAKVRELEDTYASGKGSNPDELAQQIVATSLEAHVLSRFTAYVAVDRSEVVNPGGKTQAVLQPVEMPAGWDMAPPAAMCAAPAAAPAGSGSGFGFAADLLRAAPSSLKQYPASVARRKRGVPNFLTGIFRRGSSADDTASTPPPATPASRPWPEVLVELRALAAEMLRNRGRKKIHPQLTRWVALLGELVVGLRQAGHAAVADIETLLASSEELFHRSDAGGSDAPTPQEVQVHAAGAIAILFRLDAPPQSPAPPDRDRFWA